MFTGKIPLACSPPPAAAKHAGTGLTLASRAGRGLRLRQLAEDDFLAPKHNGRLQLARYLGRLKLVPLAFNLKTQAPLPECA